MKTSSNGAHDQSHPPLKSPVRRDQPCRKFKASKRFSVVTPPERHRSPRDQTSPPPQQVMLPVWRDQRQPCGHFKPPRRFSVMAPPDRHIMSFPICRHTTDRKKIPLVIHVVETVSGRGPAAASKCSITTETSSRRSCGRKEADRVMELLRTRLSESRI
jgi:hypothetical protein